MKRIIFILTFLLALPVHADVAETGQAIAEALNKRDVEALMRQLDVDAVVRLATKDLGLGQEDRDRVRRGLPNGLRGNIATSLKAGWLRAVSRSG